MRGASEMGPRKSISKLSRPDPNFLVHDYLGLSLPRVWDVVERDLPAFRAAVMGNWGTLLPTLTYADPVRGAIVALVAFCLVRRRHGRAREVMTDARGEMTDPAPASGLLQSLQGDPAVSSASR